MVIFMISIIQDTSAPPTGKNRKLGENTLKPACIKEDNDHMKGVDHAYKFLSCCSPLRKMMK